MTQVVANVIRISTPNLHYVANVRSDELPRLAELAAMMKGEVNDDGGRVEDGQRTPLHVFNLAEYIDTLEDAIPELQELVSELDGNDKAAMEDELAEMQARLKALLSIETDSPENEYVLHDGHRRYTAASNEEYGDYAYEYFSAIVIPPMASTSDVELEQAVYGLSSETLNPVEEGILYHNQQKRGRQIKEIMAKMGCSKSHVIQRVNLAKSVVVAEQVGTEAALDYIEAVKANSVPVQVANKVAQVKSKKDGSLHFEKEPVKDSQLNSLYEAALADTLKIGEAEVSNTGDNFVKFANTVLGKSKEAVNPANGEEKASSKGSESEGTEGGDTETRTRKMVSEKDFLGMYNKFAALREVVNDEDSEGIPAEDVKYINTIASAFDAVSTGTAPSVPESLEESAEAYDAAIAEEEAKLEEERAEKRKESAAKRSKASKAKKEAEKAEEDAWKEAFAMTAGSTKASIEKAEKQIESNNEKIEALQPKLVEVGEGEEEPAESVKARKSIARLESRNSAMEKGLEQSRSLFEQQLEEVLATKPDSLDKKDKKSISSAEDKVAELTEAIENFDPEAAKAEFKQLNSEGKIKDNDATPESYAVEAKEKLEKGLDFYLRKIDSLTLTLKPTEESTDSE